MGIRTAAPEDAEHIRILMDQLGYPLEEDQIRAKLDRLRSHPDHVMLVHEGTEGLDGVLSMHIIPMLGLDGDLAVISYFSVEDRSRSRGIGTALESFAEEIARSRGCVRMEVHCNLRRMDAHRFYARRGFVESRIFFRKELLRP